MISVIKKVIIFLLILCMFPIPVFSETYDNKAIIEHEGKEGYFFDKETGDKILQDLIEYHKLKNELIPSLELKLKFQNYDLELHKRDIQFVEKINEKLEKSLDESEELRIKETSYLREQLDKKQAWYRHPVTYFVVGIVIGGALSVGLSFGLQEARN